MSAYPSYGSLGHSALYQADPTLYLGGPKAPTAEVGLMWTEARRRRRMLEGCWEYDIRASLRTLVDEERLAAWGRVDQSKNLALSLIMQLAVLHAREPVVWREGAPANDPITEALVGAIRMAGLWQLGTHLQQLVLGQREGAICVHRYADRRTGADRIGYQVIPLDLQWAVGHPDTPDEPHTWYRYRQRQVVADQPACWCRDAYSVEDVDRPYFRVEDCDGQPVDVPGVPAAYGEEYLWRYDDGTPFLPATLYHALRTGKMFDYSRGIELFDGALRVAGLWVLWQHVVRDASWPQRWTVNMEVAGAKPIDGVARVVSDPACILNFETRSGQPGSAGQWLPGGDPEGIGRAIQAYAADLSAGFDMAPSDVKRVHGDARSGYAIEITKDGQREAQKKYGPQFMRGDLDILAKTAALLGLPDEGWRMRYTGVASTFSERQLLIEEHETRMVHGLSSPVVMMAALEDVSEDEARTRLRQMRQDNAEFRMTMDTGM